MKYFYHGSNGWYCRKCVTYISSRKPEDHSKIVDSEYQLKFQLTDRQKEVSQKLADLVRQNRSVLLEAVCGAGKTELVYQSISESLSAGKSVGFAIARRQVVLEIAERLAATFPALKVVAVCQGHTKDIDGDLIVCTTHQLYRYNDYFDLLIIDEPDAFPFKGNQTLQGFAVRACHGSTVYLTATPDEKLMKLVKDNLISHLQLNKRPSGKDMCVPEVRYGFVPVIMALGAVRLYQLLKTGKPVIIFVPTIKMARRLSFILRFFMSCCNVDSQISQRDAIIEEFRTGKYQVCVSTTVLERGVTIPKTSVIVLLADSGQFDEASLTQMAGRVGRSVSDPGGYCYFLARCRKESIDGCISRIVRANLS